MLPCYRVKKDNVKYNKQPNRRKTTEQYKKELQSKNPNIKVLGEYINAKTKILHKCTIHNIEWQISPSNALKGQGCHLCRSEKISNKLSMTYEQYLEKLQFKNSNIELIDKYINSNTRVLHRYKKCGHEVMIAPQNALLGFGCDKCTRKNVGKKFKYSQSEYEKIVYKNNPTIKILGEYTSATNPIDCKCLVCGHKWSPIADSLSRKKYSSCPICAIKLNANNLRKTLDTYINEVYTINPYIKVVGNYISNNTPLEHECLFCKHHWFTTPSNILQGSGCPVCSLSHGEREIMKILDLYKIKYKPQKTFVGLVGLKNGLLSYDFYLPQYNLLIEFQGEQHEKPHSGIFGGKKQFIIQQQHDKRKREYAKRHNIKLLEIWYYDIDKTEEILIKELNLNKECVTTAG